MPQDIVSITYPRINYPAGGACMCGRFDAKQQNVPQSYDFVPRPHFAAQKPDACESAAHSKPMVAEKGTFANQRLLVACL